MANLIFPCKSCGVWHDASVPCSTSQQLRESTHGEAETQAQSAGDPQPVLTLASLVRQADQMENEALHRFHLLRDLGPATEDLT